MELFDNKAELHLQQFLIKGRKNRLLLLRPKMPRLGTPFLTQKIPRKSLSGSPGVLSQEMRHINSFLGVRNGAFWVGAKKFMFKSLCACLSLTYF